MIVFDSSPLIYLTQIGKIDSIINLFKDVYIPTAVYKEVVVMGIKDNRTDAKIIENYIKEKKIQVANVSVLEIFKEILHPGEREALALAKRKVLF